jgi:tripartite-type tricarboxylate transporter receptor subunit TctC
LPKPSGDYLNDEPGSNFLMSNKSRGRDLMSENRYDPIGERAIDMKPTATEQAKISRRAAVTMLAGAAAWTMSPSRAVAQSYPDRPVRILVPFAAGGPSDIVARLIATKLSDNLGKQFYVENMGGAGGNIGMTAAARSSSDGYTVMLASPSLVINPLLFSKVSFDPFGDFAPITNASDSPNLYFVHPSVQANTLKELIDLIKANPGKYTYATGGTGTVGHLAVEFLKMSAGLDLTHVPYRGSGPSLQSILGGHNQIGCMTLGTVSGLLDKVRPLAVTSSTRFPSAPDVPTIAEAGFPGQESSTWQGFFVRTGTSKTVIDFLYKEIAKVMAEPSLRQRLAELGFTPILNTPDDFGRQLRAEHEKWKKVIKQSNISAE